ncbi:MAG: O-antigen ligase family protein, partial [Oscillospiraceae bacterium]
MVIIMEKKGFLSKLMEIFFDHHLFRMVLLVMVALRTCSFLNPVIGPFVKFTLIWSACILIKDLFTERLLVVNRYRGILYLFLISYAITAVLNRQENFSRNLAMLCYMITNMMVLYSYDSKNAPGQIKKELLQFNHVFLIVSFAGQLISLVTFVMNLKFSYTIGETIYYYGVYNGRLWGFFSNPNAASFFAVLSVMLTTACLAIMKGNLPKRWKRFYMVDAVVQMIVLFLCNSRSSMLTLSFYLILLVVLIAMPRYKTESDKKLLTKKILAVAIAIPLVITGAHQFSMSILPHFVIPNSALSEQLIQNLPNMEIPLNDEMIGSEDLEREDYGSKFGGRYFLWQSGMKIIKEAPVFGVGAENVPDQAYQYAARYFTNFGDNVYLPGVSGGLHNLFFQIAASSGLMGLLLFGIFGVMLLVRIIRYLIWSYQNQKSNPLAVVCIGVIITILLHTMMDTGIIYGHYYLGVIFWMYLSALMYFIDREYPKGRKPVLAILDGKFRR